MQEVAELVRAVLSGKLDVATLLRSQPRFAPQPSNVTTEVSRPPLRVTIDNESSDRCTVIDIFALDKPGLLYAIARTLYDLELSLVLAKISTHFDQVVDVFYVTGADGRKIRDSHRLRAMRAALLESLDRFYGKDASSSETSMLDHASSQREAK
jgi:[protein-PII] uridylyltransferase